MIPTPAVAYVAREMAYDAGIEQSLDAMADRWDKTMAGLDATYGAFAHRG